MPLISVIIPAYNAQKTIQETINSVLEQTFTDWELIVIDDGSQDDTVKVVKNITDPRIKIFSYPNARQAVSRNRGLAQATGDYIAFLDADDQWSADKLEAQFNTLKANPSAAVAYSWTNWIDESSQFLRRGGYPQFNGNVYSQMLLGNFLENGSNPLIKSQALAKIGNFDPALTPAEDWDLYLRLAACYQFALVPAAQIFYRVSAESASSQLVNLELACLQVVKKAFEQAPSSLKYLQRDSLANLYKYLTFKALEGGLTASKARQAARFFWTAIKHDHGLLQAKVSVKVWCQIILATLFPASLNQVLFTRFPAIVNLQPLLGYIKSEAVKS